ncbi:hypothetical protein NDU88_002113 [Pleurodeles waltl]|uniref:Uncharacterized protein n=1 Tax=Pleurodeles waltl TaxID=8319 RepID=A0AAV7NFG1_PLEWA|nr:hypothetical protein NDU88_002113 [Pleurodeles waltl]
MIGRGLSVVALWGDPILCALWNSGGGEKSMSKRSDRSDLTKALKVDPSLYSESPKKRTLSLRLRSSKSVTFAQRDLSSVSWSGNAATWSSTAVSHWSKVFSVSRKPAMSARMEEEATVKSVIFRSIASR